MVTEEQAGYWIQIDPDSKPGEPRGYLRIRGLVQDAVHQPILQYSERYGMLQRAKEIAGCFQRDSKTKLQNMIEAAMKDVDKKFASQFKSRHDSQVSP
ncbi:MAG: hypothetical protein WCP89_01385 [archaeon]